MQLAGHKTRAVFFERDHIVNTSDLRDAARGLDT